MQLSQFRSETSRSKKFVDDLNGMRTSTGTPIALSSDRRNPELTKLGREKLAVRPMLCVPLSRNPFKPPQCGERQWTIATDQANEMEKQSSVLKNECRRTRHGRRKYPHSDRNAISATMWSPRSGVLQLRANIPHFPAISRGQIRSADGKSIRYLLLIGGRFFFRQFS
jgi:hypothetical protein